MSKLANKVKRILTDNNLSVVDDWINDFGSDDYTEHLTITNSDNPSIENPIRATICVLNKEEVLVKGLAINSDDLDEDQNQNDINQLVEHIAIVLKDLI